MALQEDATAAPRIPPYTRAKRLAEEERERQLSASKDPLLQQSTPPALVGLSSPAATPPC
eukprot:gene3522-7804_t